MNDTTQQNPRTQRTPRWVWPAIGLLALVEPLQHVWIKYAHPADSVPTGLHIGDSSVFLVCMRMFDSGFYSPYASCKSPFGDHYVGYFSAPFHWLYGVLGAIGSLAHIDPFLWLGIANGICAALYLYMAYRFLREAVPAQANLAFLLFLFGGGPAGLIYLATGAAGLHTAAQFDADFTRIGFYELMEGQHLWPILHLPRLYYTLPLAIALGGMTAFFKAVRIRCPRHLAFSGFLLLVSTFLNQRIGPMAWTITLIYLLMQRNLLTRYQLKAAAVLTGGTILGGLLSMIVLRLGITFVENTLEVVRQSMWLTAFLSATLLYLLLVPGEIRRVVGKLHGFWRMAAWGMLGYLGVFAVLYAAHLAYFGNWLAGGDTAAASAVSDWALIGAAGGFLYAWRRKPDATPSPEEHGWVVIWLLLFVAIALSAFGQGWFLRLVPRRFMILIGLPIAILAAHRLQLLRIHRPRLAKGLLAALLICGATNVAVASLFFQGPLEHAPGHGPYAGMHYEYMTPYDAQLIDQLRPGRVLTPPPAPIAFGDVLALRPGAKVMIGFGLYDLSDQRLAPLADGAATFFSPEGTEDFRKAFVEAWCVDYVYCPDTAPVDPLVVDQLIGHYWLHEVARDGNGVLLQVRKQYTEPQ